MFDGVRVRNLGINVSVYPKSHFRSGEIIHCNGLLQNMCFKRLRFQEEDKVEQRTGECSNLLKMNAI